MMDYINTTNLTKHYRMVSGTVKALNGVDLNLPEKSLSVVMGQLVLGKALCCTCLVDWTG